MDNFRTAEPEQYAALMAMIPLVEGKPVVNVGGSDGTVFVCRRIHDLHVDAEEGTLFSAPEPAGQNEAHSI